MGPLEIFFSFYNHSYFFDFWILGLIKFYRILALMF
jgi:hypothetical protein